MSRLWRPAPGEWEAAQTYLEFIVEAAERERLAPSLILGIGSRETEWGTSRYLDRPGPAGRGDGGHGHGLMQIDDRSHQTFIRSGKWKDARENILYGAGVLRDSINYMDARGLAGDLLLRAGIAGYNRGPRVWNDVRNGLDPDRYTTGGNYSRDVLQRAAWFEIELANLSRSEAPPAYVEGLFRLPALDPAMIAVVGPVPVRLEPIPAQITPLHRPVTPLWVDRRTRYSQ